MIDIDHKRWTIFFIVSGCHTQDTMKSIFMTLRFHIPNSFQIERISISLRSWKMKKLIGFFLLNKLNFGIRRRFNNRQTYSFLADYRTARKRLCIQLWTPTVAYFVFEHARLMSPLYSTVFTFLETDGATFQWQIGELWIQFKSKIQ